MTLYWVWTNVAYQTPVLFHHSVSFFASFTTPSQTCAIFANVVSFFVENVVLLVEKEYQKAVEEHDRAVQ